MVRFVFVCIFIFLQIINFIKFSDDDDNTIIEMDGATFSWKDEEGFTNISSNKKNEEEEEDFEIVEPFSLKHLSIFVEKVNICSFSLLIFSWLIMVILA